MTHLRRATDADLQRVAEIHVAGWRFAYRGLIPDPIIDAVTVEARRALWREWTTEPDVTLLVVEREGVVEGFVRFGPARDVASPPAGFTEVTHLYVAPDALGCGLGHALFEAALTHARDRESAGLLLWVLEGNAHARAFYEAHGLQCDGTRKNDPAWHGEGVFEVRYGTRLHRSS